MKRPPLWGKSIEEINIILVNLKRNLLKPQASEHLRKSCLNGTEKELKKSRNLLLGGQCSKF